LPRSVVPASGVLLRESDERLSRGTGMSELLGVRGRIWLGVVGRIPRLGRLGVWGENARCIIEVGNPS